MPNKPTAAASPRRTNLPTQRGDEPELFRRHHQRLIRLVARDTGAPPALAEDACSFAWLQLLRHQPERERIVGWLRVVARHEALRLLRQQWGTQPLEVPTRDAWDAQTGEPLKRRADRRPGRHRARGRGARGPAALAGLRWHRRRVLALKLAGFSYREVKELLGVTYTNVNRHLSEARAELREAA